MVTEHLVYLLSLQREPIPALQLNLVVARPLKTAGYSRSKAIFLEKIPADTQLTPEDHIICNILSDWHKNGEITRDHEGYQLYEQQGSTLLLELLKTSRAYWVSSEGQPLKLGEERKSQVNWTPTKEGKGFLQCRVAGRNLIILPTVPLWYVDLSERCAGPIETEYDPKLLIALLATKELTAQQFKKIYSELQNRSESSRQVAPTIFDPEAWYTLVEPDKKTHWFDFELGVIVDGERVNILPLLTQIIQNYLTEYQVDSLDKLPADIKLPLRLEDGRYISMPLSRAQTIFQVLTELYDKDTLTGKHRLQLAPLRVAQVAALENMLGVTQFRWFGEEKLRELGNRLQNFTGIKEVKIPQNLQASLRPYQQQGLNWLQFLREYDLAGILADDMGLGKTIQTLAHLLTEKNSGRMTAPSLIVVPTSMVAVWQVEAERFAPGLKVLALHGLQRKRRYHEINEVDVILTTYPLLIRDGEWLLSHEYYCLVLDEAQIIKNSRAKSTQIATALNAKHRICLTGTPLENRLEELWSIFNFLLPGLLGTRAQFRRLFINPIEKLGDGQRRDILSQRIAPFLLRRTKKQVIEELPEKSEITTFVELGELQRDLYESVRLAMSTKVLEAIQTKSLSRSQLIVLEALLRLRQICCDPRLLKIDREISPVDSAKLQWLLDALPDMIADGRKILLFSSFTSMLHLIEDQLKELNIPYEKLTGKTTNRAKVIERFQGGDVPLFLISLKAGGLGLNLTAADTVIHYDPWWNPAAERQATDRAHRIGQTKAVFVYKLIARGTVEEKIIELQQKKQGLLEGLFTESAGANFNITQEDLQYLLQPLEK